MFWMTVYFVAAYAVIGLLLSVSAWDRRGRPVPPAGPDRRLRRRRFATRLLLLLPLLPYAAVAVQTVVFLPSLRPALHDAIRQDNGADQHPRIVRVLRIAPNPVVYAVLPCTGMVEKGEIGMLYTFRRVHGRWEWNGVPDCAWSDCGSADGNTFPPYPEASEF